MIFKEKVKRKVSKESFLNLLKYVDLIENKNKNINLTGFSKDRLWKEGIYESILLLEKGFGKNIENKNILDIGAGAGFPSIPFLIVYPKNNLTIIESQKKRCLFLEIVKKELNLNLKVQNIRVENFQKEEEFDFITARAVAHLKILIEISNKLGKLNSFFIFIKGPKYKEEINQSKFIIQNLNLNLNILKIEIDKKQNYLICYQKKIKTPKHFPRNWNIMKK